MSILGWIVLGVIIGALVNRFLPARFPGGLPGTVLGGAAGAFIGGGIFTVIADRPVSGFDLISLVIALFSAALLLSLIRKANGAGTDAEPRFP